jgi:hypothetical protein
MGSQQASSPAGTLVEHAEEEVLRAEVAMPDPLSLIPAQIKDLMGLLAEPPEHLASF